LESEVNAKQKPVALLGPCLLKPPLHLVSGKYVNVSMQFFVCLSTEPRKWNFYLVTQVKLI